MMTMKMKLAMTSSIAPMRNSGGVMFRSLGLVVLLLAVTACGITAPSRSDGFADLESLGVLDVDRTMSVSIGPSLLRFVARHMEDDPETVAMLRDLDGVRIQIYEIDGDPGRVAARMQRMSEHLRQDGWEPVMLVRNREDREETHMLVKLSDGRIRGMTVLTSDGESEAVVINLMGTIDPAHFSEVMVALDVDAPGVKNVQVASND